MGGKILFELVADTLVGVRNFAGAILFDHLAVIIPGSIVMDVQFTGDELRDLRGHVGIDIRLGFVVLCGFIRCKLIVGLLLNVTVVLIVIPCGHALYGFFGIALVQSGNESPVVKTDGHALAGDCGSKVVVFTGCGIADINRNAVLVHTILVVSVLQTELCVDRILCFIDFLFCEAESEFQTAVGRI